MATVSLYGTTTTTTSTKFGVAKTTSTTAAGTGKASSWIITTGGGRQLVALSLSKTTATSTSLSVFGHCNGDVYTSGSTPAQLPAGTISFAVTAVLSANVSLGTANTDWTFTLRLGTKKGTTFTKAATQTLRKTPGTVFGSKTVALAFSLILGSPILLGTSSTHLYWELVVTAPAQASSTSTASAHVKIGSTNAHLTIPGYIALTAPSAPTLTTPANGSYLTELGATTFKATYHSTDTLAQNAYAMRIRTSTSATYKYWNATSKALQSTAVWNSVTTATGASWSASLTAGVLRNATVYHWSMASQESGDNLQGSYATTFAFTAAAPPTVTVTAPTGTATEERPTVQWVAHAGSPTSQTNYRVVVYTKSQHTATGFTPGGSPNVWDSGTVASGSNSVTIGNALKDNTTYYAYVQIKQDPTQTSAWAFTSFSTLFAPPPKPTVSASTTTTGTTGYPYVKITVQCHTNVLTATSAAFGTGVGKWHAGGNTTVSKVALPVSHPNVTACMKLTPSAAGTVGAFTTPITSFVVVPGQSYTLMGTVIAGASARSCTLKAKWINATGGVISTTTVGTVTDSTSTWKRIKSTATAPASTKYVQLTLVVASVSGTSDVHYATAFSVNPGSVSTWSPGGYVGSATIEVKRSDGVYVRGASTANPHSITDPTQIGVIDDFECIPTTQYHYQARVVVASLNQVGPTSTVTATVKVQVSAWWFIDPTAVTSAVSVNPLTWNPVQTEQSSAHMVMTKPTLNVVASAMMHQDFQGSFWVNTTSTYKKFQSLLTSQRTLLILSSVAPTTDSGYFRVGPQSGGMSTGVGNKAKTTQLQASTKAAPVRTVGVTAVAQTRPPV